MPGAVLRSPAGCPPAARSSVPGRLRGGAPLPVELGDRPLLLRSMARTSLHLGSAKILPSSGSSKRPAPYSVFRMSPLAQRDVWPFELLSDTSRSWCPRSIRARDDLRNHGFPWSRVPPRAWRSSPAGWATRISLFDRALAMCLILLRWFRSCAPVRHCAVHPGDAGAGDLIRHEVLVEPDSCPAGRRRVRWSLRQSSVDAASTDLRAVSLAISASTRVELDQEHRSGSRLPSSSARRSCRARRRITFTCLGRHDGPRPTCATDAQARVEEDTVASSRRCPRVVFYSRRPPEVFPPRRLKLSRSYTGPQVVLVAVELVKCAHPFELH